MRIIYRPQVKEKIFDPAVTEQLQEEFMKRCQWWTNATKKAYAIDEENVDIVKALIYYFSGNPEFENCNIVKNGASLDKGLMICGNVGSGKTLLMRILNECFVSAYKYSIVPCDMITDIVRKDGISAMEKYQKPTRGDYTNVICFDDLGIEGRAKYYGDSINPMYDLIIKRYRLFTDSGIRTHFTTNLTMQELEQVYDVRTASRLNEMCNVIVLGGKAASKDRRK